MTEPLATKAVPTLHWPFAAKHKNCAECNREYEPPSARAAADYEAVSAPEAQTDLPHDEIVSVSAGGEPELLAGSEHIWIRREYLIQPELFEHMQKLNIDDVEYTRTRASALSPAVNDEAWAKFRNSVGFQIQFVRYSGLDIKTAIDHVCSAAQTLIDASAAQPPTTTDARCYAEGDDGAEFCGEPRSLHCTVLGNQAFWESTEGQHHLVKCMRDDHLIHHDFIPLSPTTDARAVKDTWNKAIEMALEHVRLSASAFFDKYGTSLLETAMAYARNDDERAALSSIPTDEVKQRARAAADEIANRSLAYYADLDGAPRTAKDCPNTVGKIVEIITKHFTATDVEPENK